MIRVWQDYDENCRATWAMWFGTKSMNGHIVQIVGPFPNENECRAALGG